MNKRNFVSNYIPLKTDFDALQNDMEGGIKDVASAIAGKGILSGLGVSIAGSEATVTAGVAYDGAGNRMAPAASFRATIGGISRPSVGNYKWVTLALRYEAKEEGEVIDGRNKTWPARLVDSYSTLLLEGDEGPASTVTKPDHLNWQVPLLDIRVDHSSPWENLVTDTGRRPALLSTASLLERFTQLENATKKTSIEYSKVVGELFFADAYQAPAAYSAVSPDNYFPALCLSTINSYVDISATNWPQLVPHLQGLAILTGYAGSRTSEYSVASWAVAGNVATLTLSDTTTNKNLLKALLEDKLVHGSWTNWRTVTLSAAIGNVPTGDYAITAIDTTSRTITFAATATNGSGAVTGRTVSFYPHRIAGGTAKARVFQATDRALMSDSADGEGVSGLRRRDRFQGHGHDKLTSTTGLEGGTQYAALGFGGNTSHIPHRGGQNQWSMIGTRSDGVHGNPRIGDTTRPNALTAHLYIWGRDYRA